MTKVIHISTLILLMVLVLTSGCRRRPLDYGYVDGAYLKINMDWGEINDRPNNVKALFFAQTGEAPIARFIKPDGDSIPMPFGQYNALIYNWRSNNDAQSVKFNESRAFADFQAYTDFVTLRTITGEIIAQPDSLYCWSSNEDKIISITRGTIPSSKATIVKEIFSTPKSKVLLYSFFVPVEGLQYISRAEAVLSGVSRYLNLSTGLVAGPAYLLEVSISPATDGINCRFSTFGFTPGENHTLTFKFTLIDGTVIVDNRDITIDIIDGNMPRITIPIVIPPTTGGGGAFADPDIGEWEEESENIVM